MKKIDQQELYEWCESIYSQKGQSAVFDYILEYHHDQPWSYCLACECRSPITEEAEASCLVCGSIV